MQYVEKFILYRSNKIVCDSEYGLTLYSYKSNDCTGDGEKVHRKNYTWGDCHQELLGQWPGLYQTTPHGLSKIAKRIERDDKLDEGHLYVLITKANRIVASVTAILTLVFGEILYI